MALLQIIIFASEASVSDVCWGPQFNHPTGALCAQWIASSTKALFLFPFPAPISSELTFQLFQRFSSHATYPRNRLLEASHITDSSFRWVRHHTTDGPPLKTLNIDHGDLPGIENRANHKAANHGSAQRGRHGDRSAICHPREASGCPRAPHARQRRGQGDPDLWDEPVLAGGKTLSLPVLHDR